MKSNVDLTLDLLCEYYQDAPQVISDFILFRNIKLESDKQNRYKVTNGIFVNILYTGKVKLQVNFDKYTIEAPAIISLFPDYIINSNYYSSDARADGIFISQKLIEESFFPINFGLLAQMRFNPILLISRDSVDDLYKFQKALETLYDIKDSSVRISTMRSFLYAFVNQIASNYLSLNAIEHYDKEDKRRIITYNFLNILYKTNPRERGVAFYADKLNITSKYLSFAVKSVTGLSTIKWINNAIILDAKKILSSTKFSIEQISEMLHYKSSSFFINNFKERTGMTPCEFRRKYSNL